MTLPPSISERMDSAWHRGYWIGVLVGALTATMVDFLLGRL